MIYRNECHHCGKQFPSTRPVTVCLKCAEQRGLGWPPREES